MNGRPWGGMARLSRRIRETLTEVAEAAAAAEKLCAAAGADESQSLRIGLALDELAANALTHGAMKEKAPFIQIDVWVDDQMLNLKIEAEGPRFDPTEGRPTKIEDYAIGGRGLGLVIGFADALSYQRIGERNITTFSVAKHGAVD